MMRSVVRKLILGGLAVALIFFVGCGGGGDQEDGGGDAVPVEPMEDVSPASDAWPMFMHDEYNRGCSTLDFPSDDFKEVWKFGGSEHVWTYEPGASVWSSPVVDRVDGKATLFVGSYDRSVYALDASNGEELWRFTAGASVYSAPAVWAEHDPPMLFVAATNRTIYGLNAKDRRKMWTFECMEWSDGVQCRMSSVTLAELGGGMAVFVGAWTSNPSGFRGEQKGEVVALDAVSGKLLWRKKISTGVVRTPAVVTIDDRRTVFVTSDDGVLHSLDAETGEEIWREPADEFLSSSAMFAVVQGRPLVFHGTRYHNVLARDARSGRRRWKFQTHFWVDSTPAFARVDDRPALFFGSYDRNIFAVDAISHDELWHIGTGGDICASAAVAAVEGQPAIFIHSLDDNLYCIEVPSGSILWKQNVGAKIWEHGDRGDTIWSSPCVAAVDGVATLFFASYDGNVYAFQAAKE